MVKIIKNIAATLFATFTICSTVFAGGGGFTGATEWTQLLNNGQLIKIFDNSVDQLTGIRDTLKNAENNTLLLKGDSYYWSNIEQNLIQLASIVQRNQSIAYSSQNAADLFAQKYPGWSADTTKANYKDWSQNTLDMIRGSLAAANLQSSQFADESSTLGALRTLSKSPQGRLQAIQVGNQIAVEQVAQTQKLRQLVMSQMQAQSAYMASQEQKDATRRASVEQIFPKQKAGANHDYHGF